MDRDDQEVVAEHPTIRAAMAAVFRAIGPVAKNLRNVEAGYAARSIDDLMDALHPHLAAAGVFVIPEVLEHHSSQVQGRNTVLHQVILKVRFTFHHAGGEDTVAATVYGEARDAADKATNKALQAAFKYALLDTFVIPLTGDTEDADAGHPEGDAAEEPVAPDVVAAIREKMQGVADRDAFGAAWRAAGLPAPSRIVPSMLERAEALIAAHTTTAPPVGAGVPARNVTGRETVDTPDPTEPEAPSGPTGVDDEVIADVLARYGAVTDTKIRSALDTVIKRLGVTSLGEMTRDQAEQVGAYLDRIGG